MDEPTQKCSVCEQWIDFPFGVGTVSSGLCRCSGVIYKLNSSTKKLWKCVVNDAWGSGRYTWTEVQVVP